MNELACYTRAHDAAFDRDVCCRCGGPMPEQIGNWWTDDAFHIFCGRTCAEVEDGA